MSIRKDYTIDVLRLLESLKKEIEGTRTFAGIAFGLRKDELTFTIEKIRASMPREMKDAASLTRETDRIMAEAEDEARAIQDQAIEQAQRILAEAEEKAKSIVATAKGQQEQMVSEDEILRIAKAQSEEIRAEAEKFSREMKRGANKYAADVLNNLENVVGRVFTAVEQSRQEFETSEPEVKAAVEMPRERVKA